jgi:hypothetical protein
VSNEAWNALTELAITAGMNERYWLAQQASADAMFINGMVAGVLAIVLAVLAMFIVSHFTKGSAAAMAVGQIGMWVSIVAFVGFSKPGLKDAWFAADMAHRWQQLEQQADDAIRNGQPAYEELVIQKHRLNGRKPEIKYTALLAKCLADEEKSRGAK